MLPLAYFACPPIIRFSSTVRLLNSLIFWKVRATPKRAILYVAIPVISCPSKVILPDVAGKTPLSMLMVVVLPEPFGPIRA